MVAVAVLALLASILVVTEGGGTSADAAVINAVDTAIAGKSANVSVSGSVDAGDKTATFNGTGSVDFTNNAVALALEIDEAGQHADEQALYLAGVIYEQVPGVAQVAPGKSWVSVDLSSLAQAPNQGAGGLGGNPLAMLHALALQGNTVSDLGDATFDGQPAHGYSVTLDPTVIQNEVDSANLPAWLKQAVSQVTVHEGEEKVYVDSAGHLAGATFSLVESAGSVGTVTLTESMGFSDYGTPVSITAPPADQVIPLNQLETLGG